MKINNNTPDNINPETMSKEALLIYFNKECKMRFIGDKAALFADDLYIKVSIKQGLFMLGTAYGLDFSDVRAAYFPHILDCEFENLSVILIPRENAFLNSHLATVSIKSLYRFASASICAASTGDLPSLSLLSIPSIAVFSTA